jgi:hypothetical protein
LVFFTVAYCLLPIACSHLITLSALATTLPNFRPLWVCIA